MSEVNRSYKMTFLSSALLCQPLRSRDAFPKRTLNSLEMQVYYDTGLYKLLTVTMHAVVQERNINIM